MANNVDWRGTARYFAREHDISGETVDDLCDLVVGIATAEASVARDTIARLTRERDEARAEVERLRAVLQEVRDIWPLVDWDDGSARRRMDDILYPDPVSPPDREPSEKA